MKKLIMLLMLIPFIGTAQLEIKQPVSKKEIGEVKVAGAFSISLTEMQDSYYFMYRNLKYSSIVDVQSFGFRSKQDIDELYALIIDQLPIPDKRNIDIKLYNGNTLRLDFAKNKIQFNVWDGYSLSYTAWYTEKQINQLFGK
jgi:uncharacterized protein (DUF2225 family)